MRTLSILAASNSTRSLILVAVAVMLFYPPTANGFWQQVLVTEIGPAILLAVGLNVVVGWAGLLDLGFIAFYAIGSYVTGLPGRLAAGQNRRAGCTSRRSSRSRSPSRSACSPGSRSARRRCDCVVTTWPS